MFIPILDSIMSSLTEDQIKEAIASIESELEKWKTEGLI